VSDQAISDYNPNAEIARCVRAMFTLDEGFLDERAVEPKYLDAVVGAVRHVDVPSLATAMPCGVVELLRRRPGSLGRIRGLSSGLLP